MAPTKKGDPASSMHLSLASLCVAGPRMNMLSSGTEGGTSPNVRYGS